MEQYLVISLSGFREKDNAFGLRVSVDLAQPRIVCGTRPCAARVWRAPRGRVPQRLTLLGALTYTQLW